MANKYWAAGVSGNWNSITSWSDFAIGTPAGALVPGAGDAAIFNAASGTVTATLDISPDIQTLTMTGFTGTLAFGTNTISLNSTGTVYAGTLTMTVTGTPQIILTNNTATARTVSPASVTESNSISFQIIAGTGTLALTSGSYRNLDFTDGVNPTGYAGALGNNSNTIYGNFKASTGMTRTAGTATYTFAATSGTKTINTAAVVFDCPFTFNGVGGSWQLQDALTSGATRTVTLTAGTLDLVSYTLTTGLFSSNNSNVRVLAFGTGKIVVTGSSFNVNTATNFSFTGTSNIEGTYSGAVGTRVFIIGDTAGGSQAVAMNLKITAGTDIVYVYRFWNDVDFTGFAGTFDNVGFRVLYGSLTLSTGMTLVAGTNSTTFAATSGTKTITSAGKTMDFPITFDGVGGTWQLQDALTSGATRTCTLTNGTLDLASYTLTTGLFSSNNSNTRVLAFGTGKIVLTGVSTTIFNTTIVTGMTITGTPVVDCTATTGTSVQTRTFIAGAHGESQSISVNINPGTSAVDIFRLATNSGAFKDVTFSSTFTGTIQISNTIIIYGNFDSGGATVYTGPSTVTFAATSGTKTIKTSGLVIDSPITFSGVGGTWAMQDALTLGSTRALTMTNGTLQLKAGTTSTVGSFVTTGTNGKYLLSTTFGTAATISQASGTVTVEYLTVQDSIATGGAIFDALAITNVNAGNNTGWLFSTTPSIGNEITMRLRSFTQPRRF